MLKMLTGIGIALITTIPVDIARVDEYWVEAEITSVSSHTVQVTDADGWTYVMDAAGTYRWTEGQDVRIQTDDGDIIDIQEQ